MDLKVGERVASVEDESIGTIRWIGELEDPNLKGTWIGIEWDSEGRGKHSGSYQSIKDYSFISFLFFFFFVCFLCYSQKIENKHNSFLFVFFFSISFISFEFLF